MTNETKHYNGVDAMGNKVINVADPTSAQDAATKAYADLKVTVDSSSAVLTFTSLGDGTYSMQVTV